MKKMIMGTLVTVSILGASASYVQAAETPATAKSDAIIELTKVDDGDIPGIIDPEVKPPTGQTGEFTLDLVPSFAFPSLTVEGGTVALASDTLTGVQVSDRRAAEKGWTLKVGLGDFNNKVAESEWKKLNGATLNAAIIGSLKTTEGNVNAAPATSPISLEVGGAEAVLMTTGSETSSGKGSWFGYFSDGTSETATSLTVPAGNFAGNYQAEMVWTLSATQL